jgi:hypothetical protein
MIMSHGHVKDFKNYLTYIQVYCEMWKKKKKKMMIYSDIK